MIYTKASGILAQSEGPLFGGRTFYLSRGKRHWVGDTRWMNANGFVYPDDVKIVTDDVLLSFLPGQNAPAWTPPGNLVLENAFQARQASAARISGTGLEVGAGGQPFPVPLDCEVIYGDMYSYEELFTNAYAGQAPHDIVAPALKTNLDTLENVADRSMDFIVACHVIEHTKSPIGAITAAYAKLRLGGSLVLVIPDKERTFDKPRPVTSLEHMVDDYRRSFPDRDRDHYHEFYSLADGFQVAPESFEAHWQKQWQDDVSIHFHTWTYDSFGEMIAWIQKNSAPYRSVWSSSCMPDGIEFYYTLTK